jgi:hypothetical protein
MYEDKFSLADLKSRIATWDPSGKSLSIFCIPVSNASSNDKYFGDVEQEQIIKDKAKSNLFIKTPLLHYAIGKYFRQPYFVNNLQKCRITFRLLATFLRPE